MDKTRIAAIVARIYLILIIAAVLQFVKEECYMRMLMIVFLPYMLMYSLWFSAGKSEEQKQPLWVRALIGVGYAILSFGFAYYQNWLKL